ncbi:MAG: hypothetical protein ACYTDT_02990 [Planctomycetota bacterium]|jgi:ribosomal protein S27AE
MAWTQQRRDDIVKRITEAGVNRPCPRCGSENFRLVDGYAVFGMVENLEDEGVKNLVPSACVACSQCGFLTFHALATLDLLPKEQPLPKQDRETSVE